MAARPLTQSAMVSCSIVMFPAMEASDSRAPAKRGAETILRKRGLPKNYSANCITGAADRPSVKMKPEGLSLAAKTLMTTELLGKSKEELRAFCVALGEPAFRGTQIYHALYSERKFNAGQITNLPLALRERL